MDNKYEVLDARGFWRAVYQASAIHLASTGCGPEYVRARSREVADQALAGDEANDGDQEEVARG